MTFNYFTKNFFDVVQLKNASIDYGWEFEDLL